MPSNKALLEILSILLLSILGQCSGSCLRRDPRLGSLCLRTLRQREKEKEVEEVVEEEEEGRKVLRSLHHNLSCALNGNEETWP